MIQNSCDHGTFDLHRALGTELLAAEALDTFLTVNNGDAILHNDRLGRTDVCTFSASDTFLAIYGGACGKTGLCNIRLGMVKPGVLLTEQVTVVIADHGKVGNDKRIQIAVYREVIRRRGDQFSSARRLQRGNILDALADHPSRTEVQTMGAA